jgi:hypothetical protein
LEARGREEEEGEVVVARVWCHLNHLMGDNMRIKFVVFLSI